MMWKIYQPVPVIFGAGKRQLIGDILQEKGFQRAFLLCGNSMIRTGNADFLEKAAGGRIIGRSSDIESDPTLQNIDDNAALVRKAGADCIIAMGGGSIMDCAKSVAVAVAEGCSGEDLMQGHVITKALPLILLPSTAGSGSEVTSAAGITDKIRQKKGGIMSPLLYATTAIVDPELTYSVPYKTAAHAGLDALAHALDVLLSQRLQPYSEALALRSASLVLENIEAAVTQSDTTARDQMAAASNLAGLALSQIGTSGSHACADTLALHYHLPHGEACAFTLAEWVRVSRSVRPELDRMARQLGLADAAALAGRIDELKETFGLHTRLSQLGGTAADIPSLVTESLASRSMQAAVAQLSREEMTAFYQRLL